MWEKISVLKKAIYLQKIASYNGSDQSIVRSELCTVQYTAVVANYKKPFVNLQTTFCILF